MNRLTQKNKQGEWRLKGVSWEQLNAGEKIARDTRMLLYGALYKLMRYEDTGLIPEQIGEIDDLYHEKCKEVAELKKKQQWIPVEEQLPEDDSYILVSFKNLSLPIIGWYEAAETGGAFHICDDEESRISQGLFVNAWMPLPEPYRQQSVNTAPEPPVQAECKLEDNEY